MLPVRDFPWRRRNFRFSTLHWRGLAATLVLLACAAAGEAQENAIKNPGFEGTPTKAGLPGDGWWLYEGRGQPEVGVDRSVTHAGAAAVRLAAKEEARFVLVSAPFDVSPGDELRFEAWVRAEEGGSTGARGNFGPAFRNAAGAVFERGYIPAETRRGEWTLVSGTATAPAAAVRAEIHLGYNNAPGALWYDDVRAVITNPLSLSLAEGAQPWTGPQAIVVRVINRQTSAFQGAVRAAVARKSSEVAVNLAPGANELVKVPIALGSVGNFDYTIDLLEAGKAVRTLKGRFHTTAPLVLFPACPCDHLVGEGGGETRVDARIVVNPAQRSGLRLAVAIADAAGKQIDAATADASTGEIAGVTLRVPIAAPATFGVTARLLDSAGKELAKEATDVRVRPRGESQVAMGEDGFLRIGGRPHFPIGMYSSGAARNEEMARAGFSATHSYGITTGEAAEAINPNDAQLKQLLDRSWSNGMRMMVELPRKAIEKAQWAQVRRRIGTFRHHPGLLCWGSEERVARGEALLANIAALHRLVCELDPDHPLVLGDTRDVIGKLQKDRRNFFPDDCMEAGIWWWYPIPLHAPDGNGLDGREKNAGLLQPPSWLTTTLSPRPLWIAIQSYQQPRQDARFPTPAEYRCMAYLSVINGVKGLWFYTGSGQRDWQGKPAGLFNKPEEGHWEDVQKLVRELREMEPVITSRTVTDKIAMAPAEAPVEFTVRDSGGVLHLIAANKSEQAQRVRFSGAALAGRKVRALYEEQSPAREGGELAGDFGPFGVHVYRIE